MPCGGDAADSVPFSAAEVAAAENAVAFENDEAVAKIMIAAAANKMDWMGGLKHLRFALAFDAALGHVAAVAADAEAASFCEVVKIRLPLQMPLGACLLSAGVPLTVHFFPAAAVACGLG